MSTGLLVLPKTASGRQILAIKPRTPGFLHTTIDADFDGIANSEWTVLCLHRKHEAGVYDYVVWTMSGLGICSQGTYFEHVDRGQLDHLHRAWEEFNRR